MERRRTIGMRVAAVAVGLVVLAGGVTIAVVARVSAAPKALSAEALPASQATSVSKAGKPVAVAIGDSIMDGHGLGTDVDYPEMVADSEGWDLHNLATDGTGYVTLGHDHNTFQAQADEALDLDPQIVVIAGSSNDLGKSDAAIFQAVTKLVTTLSIALPNAKIVAVNTFWGDTKPPAQIATIDSDVKKAVVAAGGRYIDIGQPLSGQSDLMQGDDVHPTAAGQEILASAIESRLGR